VSHYSSNIPSNIILPATYNLPNGFFLRGFPIKIINNNYKSSIIVYRLDDQGSILRSWNASINPYIQNSCGDHPPSNVYWKLFPLGAKRPEFKLNTHINLALKSVKTKNFTPDSCTRLHSGLHTQRRNFTLFRKKCLTWKCYLNFVYEFKVQQYTAGISYYKAINADKHLWNLIT